jgi:hypothetical protein
VNSFRLPEIDDFVTLNQACQTQTTSRATKALKTAKGAAKILNVGHILQN